MKDFIHKVGKGPHHAEDLNTAEAENAMRVLLEGRASPLQIGGFLVGLRTKGETPEEIAAFTRVLREYGRKIDGPPNLLDIPAYAGKSKTFHALPAAALVMAAGGVPVLLHAYNDAPGRVGTGEILEALGIGGDLDAGIAYLDVKEFHPRLFEFLELRKELGVRSVFNVIARLANPGGARRHLIAITHQPYFEKFSGALRILGTDHAMVFMGSEGETEAPFHGVTRAVETPGGDATYRPEEFGLPRPRFEDVAARDLDEEVRLTNRILSGEKHPARTLVILTAAAGLYVGGVAASFREGVTLATDLLESGSASRRVNESTSLNH